MCFIELKQTQTLENVVGGQTNYKILDQKMDWSQTKKLQISSRLPLNLNINSFALLIIKKFPF